MPLLLPFILLPILELVVFIQVGSKIGALAVIALIIVSAFLGSAVIRAQGFITLEKARMRMAEGAIPAKELAEGMLLSGAGLLLIIPGFITSTAGLVLLLPFVRKSLVGMAAKKLNQGVVFTQFGQSSQPTEKEVHGFDFEEKTERIERPNIIEGEFRRED